MIVAHDINEARTLLSEYMAEYRRHSYFNLARFVNEHRIDTLGRTGPTTHTKYQLGVQFFWDDHPNGNIRVAGDIDDGRASTPLLCDDFIVRSDVTFVSDAEL